MGGEGNAAGYVIAPRYWAWLGSRRAISVLLWLAALAAGAHMLWHALTWFDARPHAPDFERRADGNGGHAQIDFGGQWVMARMLVLGHGRELYHRQRQWEVVRAGFPVADESPVARDESILPRDQRRAGAPDDLNHDANHLLRWMMGEDPRAWGVVAGAGAAPLAPNAFGNPLAAASMELAAAELVSPAVVAEVSRPAIGGPLYPPVQALFYAPLGMIERPQTAYRVAQLFGSLMVVVAGLGVKVLSRGGIPWSVATLVLFLFPGTRSGLDLGQNPTLSLAIVVWGWALMARGYHAAGGAVWGCSRSSRCGRSRSSSCRCSCGGGGSARDGHHRGRAGPPHLRSSDCKRGSTGSSGAESARVYNLDHNWIHLSRDLQSVRAHPARLFPPQRPRDTAAGERAGLGPVGAGVRDDRDRIPPIRRPRERPSRGAFLFFSAFLTCYPFMYYDALLAVAGCAVLFAEPARFLRRESSASRCRSPRYPRRELPAPLRRGVSARDYSGRLFVPAHDPRAVSALRNSLNGLDIRATLGSVLRPCDDGGQRNDRHEIPKVQFDTGVDYPWETALASRCGRGAVGG